MPRRKKGRINRGSPEYSRSSQHLPSPEEREKAVQHLQETFASQIDPDVVYIILSECDYNVDAALETLITLASANADSRDAAGINSERIYTDANHSSSDAGFITLLGGTTTQDNFPEDISSRCRPASFHSDDHQSLHELSSPSNDFYLGSHEIYKSNEDLYCEDSADMEKLTASNNHLFMDQAFFNYQAKPSLPSENNVQIPINSKSESVVSESESSEISDGISKLSIFNQQSNCPDSEFSILPNDLVNIKRDSSPDTASSVEGDASESVNTSFGLDPTNPSDNVLSSEEDDFLQDVGGCETSKSDTSNNKNDLSRNHQRSVDFQIALTSENNQSSSVHQPETLAVETASFQPNSFPESSATEVPKFIIPSMANVPRKPSPSLLQQSRLFIPQSMKIGVPTGVFYSPGFSNNGSSQSQNCTDANNSSDVLQEDTEIPPFERVLKCLQQREKILIILRGLPGSGKSTLAKRLKFQGVILSTDDYFVRRGKYMFDITKITEAHEWNKQRTRKQLIEGTSPIIIDNTNVEAWEMKPYVFLGIHFGYKIEILEPETPWKFKPKELALKNRHGVSKEKIIRMLDRYEKNVTVERILKPYDVFSNLASNKQDVDDTSTIEISKSKELNEAKGLAETSPTTSNSTSTDNTVYSANDFVAIQADMNQTEDSSTDTSEFKSVGSGEETSECKNSLVPFESQECDTSKVNIESSVSLNETVGHEDRKDNSEVISDDIDTDKDNHPVKQENRSSTGLHLHDYSQEDPEFWKLDSENEIKSPSTTDADSIQSQQESKKSLETSRRSSKIRFRHEQGSPSNLKENVNFILPAINRTNSDAGDLCFWDVSTDAEHTWNSKDVPEQTTGKQEAFDPKPPRQSVADLENINIFDESASNSCPECRETDSKLNSACASKKCSRRKLAANFDNAFLTDEQFMEIIGDNWNIPDYCTLEESETNLTEDDIQKVVECLESFNLSESEEFHMPEKVSNVSYATDVNNLAMLQNPNSCENHPLVDLHPNEYFGHYSLSNEPSQNSDNLLKLSACFPDISVEQLQDVLEKRNQNTVSAANILLDPNEGTYFEAVCFQKNSLSKNSVEIENTNFFKHQPLEHYSSNNILTASLANTNLSLETEFPASNSNVQQQNWSDSEYLDAETNSFEEESFIRPSQSLPNSQQCEDSLIIFSDFKKHSHMDASQAHMYYNNIAPYKDMNSSGADEDLNLLASNDDDNDDDDDDDNNGDISDVCDEDENEESLDKMLGFTITLEPQMALQLEELFGSAGLTHNPGSEMLSFGGYSTLVPWKTALLGPTWRPPKQTRVKPGKEDLTVEVDLQLAWEIYRCWMKTLHKKAGMIKDPELEKKLKDDEALARKLQEEEDASFAFALSPQRKFPGDPTLPSATSSRPSTDLELPNLREIMDLELAVQISQADAAQMQKKQMANTVDNLANRLKRRQLFEMFPGIDKNALQETFEANDYSLNSTIQAVEALIGKKGEIPKDMENAFERELQNMYGKPEPSQDSYTNIIENNDISVDSFHDLRAEAALHYRMRNECFQKAQEAYQKGMKAVASFYAQQGHLHTDKMWEANQRASNIIIKCRNHKVDANTLDLHLLFVNEAVDVLREFLIQKQRELEENSLRKLVVHIITGRGIHSHNKIPRIKLAVVQFLQQQKYRFEEVNAGLIDVILS